MIQHGMKRRGMIWHGMKRHGMKRRGMIWHGMIRHGMKRRGTIWYGMIRCGMIRCGMMRRGIKIILLRRVPKVHAHRPAGTMLHLNVRQSRTTSSCPVRTNYGSEGSGPLKKGPTLVLRGSRNAGAESAGPETFSGYTDAIENPYQRFGSTIRNPYQRFGFPMVATRALWWVGTGAAASPFRTGFPVIRSDPGLQSLRFLTLGCHR
ncbi:hypothetical protein APED_06765 [Acanthopleuribacter pedis]